MNKALRGIRGLLDDRIRTLRKQQEFDADANIARQLQAELEQEDVRRQVGLAWPRMPSATILFVLAASLELTEQELGFRCLCLGFGG